MSPGSHVLLRPARQSTNSPPELDSTSALFVEQSVNVFSFLTQAQGEVLGSSWKPLLLLWMPSLGKELCTGRGAMIRAICSG